MYKSVMRQKYSEAMQEQERILKILSYNHAVFETMLNKIHLLVKRKKYEKLEKKLEEYRVELKRVRGGAHN